MKANELTNAVRNLGTLITDAPSKLSPKTMNEEWTKKHLIVPLLEALGWNSPYEVLPEDSPVDIDDWIDYLLKPQRSDASRLCLEAKPLLSAPPRDRSHEQIKKGLEQTKARDADYFIWTNGDTWQLLATKLACAPIYEITISQARGDESEIQVISDKLRLLSRETVVNNPQAIAEEITAYWRQMALPQAFAALSNELAEDTIKLMTRVLPHELAFSPAEILLFLKGCRWEGADKRHQNSLPARTRKFRPCPQEWEKLVTSLEPRYVRARETLLADPRRKLGEYLISDGYQPWRATVTFHLLGLPRRGTETKTVTGPAVERYKLYGFIDIVDPQARPDDITYRRIEEAMPYLKQILNP
jgi:hypothetical protein